jgi:hypothetical protein
VRKLGRPKSLFLAGFECLNSQGLLCFPFETGTRIDFYTYFVSSNPTIWNTFIDHFVVDARTHVVDTSQILFCRYRAYVGNPHPYIEKSTFVGDLGKIGTI